MQESESVHGGTSPYYVFVLIYVKYMPYFSPLMLCFRNTLETIGKCTTIERISSIL